MFHQWIEEKASSSATGTDFSGAIRATQLAAKAFVENRKLPLSKRLETLSAFADRVSKNQISWQNKLINVLGYSPPEAELEIHGAIENLRSLATRLQSTPESLPVGPCLIFGSWSSPILRFSQAVLAALTNGNAVLLLTGPTASSLYVELAQEWMISGAPTGSLSVISTEEQEMQEILFSHPSVKLIHVTSHLNEISLARSLKFETNKKVKLFFGGHNPVIWTHDAPLVNLESHLKSCLQYHLRGEERFQRWFVQEKNYALFVEEFKKCFSYFKAVDFGKLLDKKTADQFTEQMKNMAKERNWLTNPLAPWASDQTPQIQASLDFNNCSSWQQTANLGPVITLTRYKNSQEAVKFCNTTHYANAAVIMAGSHEKAQEIGKQLQMPKIYLNTFPKSQFDSAHFAAWESGQGNEVSDFDFFRLPKTFIS